MKHGFIVLLCLVGGGSYQPVFAEDDGLMFFDTRARVLAIDQIRYDFGKVNQALEHCDITKGMKIDPDLSDVEITEVK